MMRLKDYLLHFPKPCSMHSNKGMNTQASCMEYLLFVSSNLKKPQVVSVLTLDVLCWPDFLKSHSTWLVFQRIGAKITSLEPVVEVCFTTLFLWQRRLILVFDISKFGFKLIIHKKQ